ncbi:MAG: polyprenyl diphosphate synthase, partial [Candidatus Omnitrophica bacterium]|nr:polyprenyl diphosphate synthase [Candidatus Omnitrophota bacterium]
LMRALVGFLGREANLLHKKNIRLVVIGRKDPLPGYVQDKIIAVVEKTKANTGLTVVLALNYGARQEITDAARKFAEAAMRGEINPADLDIDKFKSFFYDADLPDPELLIRTSGEMRLSNFLLWQLSYAELYFPETHWPDFGTSDFKKAIRVYQKRERRFGGIKC